MPTSHLNLVSHETLHQRFSLAINEEDLDERMRNALQPFWIWNWRRSASPDLLNAMTNNPRMKILVMNGIYDMATPFGATEYTFDHMGLNKTLKANVTQKYYEAGHMMYTHEASAAKFKKDLVEFIVGTFKLKQQCCKNAG